MLTDNEIMNRLIKEQKQFIDDNFYEGLSENELDRSKFELLTTQEELHYLADKHNWDDGVKLLQWIAESRACSEATALEIFWLAQPSEFQTYKLTQNLKDKYEDSVFTLIKTILKNFQDGLYIKSNIHFDPASYLPKDNSIPDFMKQPTAGEEPYIYYEEKEVNSWFGEHLKNQVARCDTEIELFNIASFVKEPERAKMILEHPLCDKGTALLVFWRLKTYANMWFETSNMVEELIEKIRNNQYKAVLAYNPATDKEIRLSEPKPKWTIPDRMMQGV